MSLLDKVTLSWEGKNDATVQEAEEHIQRLQALIDNLKQFNKLHSELQVEDNCSKLEVLVISPATESVSSTDIPSPPPPPPRRELVEPTLQSVFDDWNVPMPTTLRTRFMTTN